MKNADQPNNLLESLYKNGSVPLSATKHRLYLHALTNLIDTNQLVIFSRGQIGYAGPLLQLFRYFDMTFLDLAIKFGAKEVIYPTTLAQSTLEKAEYFTSFPNIATKVTTSSYLSPALCYLVYQQLENRVIGTTPLAFTTMGKCYRNEKTYQPLERQWEFSMREIVFIGTSASVEALRKKFIQEISMFAEQLVLEGVIEKASDPFFISGEENRGKKLLQRIKPLKFELCVPIAKQKKLAICSFNNHEQFFGDHFKITLPDKTVASSVCIAFGLERWILAILIQYGPDAKFWPALIREKIDE